MPRNMDMSNVVERRCGNMKIKQLLLNLLPIALFFIHTLLAKYDTVHYMTSTSFAIILIGLLPLVFSIINYYDSNTIIHLIVLNFIFTVSQLIGFIIYDIVMVGSISDTFAILTIPTIFYVLILTAIEVLLQVIKRRGK